MNEKRNSFIGQAVSVLCSIILIVVYSPLASAQQPVSPAVIENSGKVFAQVLNHARIQGKFSVSDFYQTQVAAKILFAHLDETGFTDAAEKKILALDPASFTVDDATVKSMRIRMNLLGGNVTDSDVRNMMNLTPERAANVIAAVRKSGLRGVHAKAVASLQFFAERELANSRGGSLFHLAKACYPQSCDINTGVCDQSGSCDCACLTGLVNTLALEGALAFLVGQPEVGTPVLFLAAALAEVAFAAGC